MDGAVWRAARRRRQRSENNSRTGCYRFATQLRVTVRDRTGWLEGQSAQNQASRRLANTTWDRTKRQLCNQEMGGARHPAAGPPATSVVSVGTVRVAKDHAVTAPATIGARCGRGPSRPTRRATVSGVGEGGGRGFRRAHRDISDFEMPRRCRPTIQPTNRTTRAEAVFIQGSLVRKDAVDLALRHRLPLLSTS
jgi:hypothetical protein